jgi:hypothetical protein
VTVRITTEQGIDVTEGVQAAYDLVLNSMDWGSGFLTVDDIEPLIRLAIAADYDLEPIIGYISGSLFQRFSEPMPPSARYGDPEYEAWNKRAGAWNREQQAIADGRARAQIEALRQEMAS